MRQAGAADWLAGSCLYVYIYIYIYMYIYIYIHAYIHINIYLFIYLSTLVNPLPFQHQPPKRHEMFKHHWELTLEHCKGSR